MAIKRTPRPRDPVQLGKLMVDIITGQVPDVIDDGKNDAKVEKARMAGRLGGDARAQRLSPKQRSEIAGMGAAKRWKPTDP